MIMEIGQNTRPVTVTFGDGTVKQVIYDSFELLDGGDVCMRGHLVDPVTEQVAGEQIEECAPKERPYIRSYFFKSGLLRFLHNGHMHTAAITHCTDKAWRVINRELGVTWLPKNIIRWSEIAHQFCVIDERYEMNFTFNVRAGEDEYPSIFNPEELINHELD